MISIIDGVRHAVDQDDIARTAMARGVLNMSAYANRIRKDVENFTKKPVKASTIVTALTRIAGKLKESRPEIPDVAILDVAMKSNIVELSYERASEVLSKISRFQESLRQDNPSFMTTTIGVHEITVLASTDVVERIEKLLLPARPKLKRGGLIAITAHSTPDIIDIPNVTYALLRRIALRNINLVEIVSTYTEITFIVAQKDAPQVIELLS